MFETSSDFQKKRAKSVTLCNLSLYVLFRIRIDQEFVDDLLLQALNGSSSMPRILQRTAAYLAW